MANWHPDRSISSGWSTALGSMYGEKIGTVNHAIQSTIPEMADAAKDNPNAQLLVRTLKFSTGASWVTTAPVRIEDFAWDDLDAGGVTDLGKAFEMLAAQLTIPRVGARSAAGIGAAFGWSAD